MQPTGGERVEVEFGAIADDVPALSRVAVLEKACGLSELFGEQTGGRLVGKDLQERRLKVREELCLTRDGDGPEAGIGFGEERLSGGVEEEGGLAEEASDGD